MMDLNIYIKNEFIKNKLKEIPYIYINNIEEAERIAYDISMGKYINIIFESSYLKNIFFSIIKLNRPDVSIINCNSNIKIFEDNILNNNGFIIYNNINRNIDNNVIEIIKENKGIFVC